MIKAILATAIILIAISFSWAFCVGVIWLICLLLPITFSLKYATAIWLIIILVKPIFSGNQKND